MLEDQYTLDFIAKKTGKKPHCNSELYRIEEHLFIPVCSLLLGYHGAGKSMTLQLIQFCYSLFEGKILFRPEDFSEEEISIELFFFDQGKLYHYTCEILPPKKTKVFFENYCIFKNQTLHFKYVEKFQEKRFWKGRWNVLHTKISPHPTDYSLLAFFHFQKPAMRMVKHYSKEELFQRFNECIPYLSSDTASILYELFHLPFHQLEAIGEDRYLVHYSNAKLEVEKSQLNKLFTSGTMYGILLYAYTLFALEEGALLVIDESEINIHSELMIHILHLFLNKEANRYGATLILSTFHHYLIDVFQRFDFIHILTKNDEGRVSIHPLLHYFTNRIRTRGSKLFYLSHLGIVPDYVKLNEILRNIVSKIYV